MFTNKIFAIKSLREMLQTLMPTVVPRERVDFPGRFEYVLQNQVPTLKSSKDFVEACMALGVREYLESQRGAQVDTSFAVRASGRELFTGLLIVPTTQVHDSGYPIMRIYGITEALHEGELLAARLVLVSSGCDSLDMQNLPSLKADILAGYQHIFCRHNYIQASGCSTVNVTAGPRKE